MGRTLKRFLKIATVGAEIRESGKLFQSLTTLFEKKWPANLVLVRLTNNFLECLTSYVLRLTSILVGR